MTFDNKKAEGRKEEGREGGREGGKEGGREERREGKNTATQGTLSKENLHCAKILVEESIPVPWTIAKCLFFRQSALCAFVCGLCVLWIKCLVYTIHNYCGKCLQVGDIPQLVSWIFGTLKVFFALCH